MMRSIFGLLISPLFVLFVVWPEAWAQLNDFVRQEFTFENALAGKNPGFESGTVQWTASGGTFAVNSGTQIVPNSKQFATWDSNSAGQTLQTAAVTVPKTGNCEFSIWIAVPSGTATHTITVTDGTNDIVTAQTITNNTNALKHIVPFPCPSSGTVRGKLTSVNVNEPSISLDNARLGSVTIVGLANLDTEWTQYSVPSISAISGTLTNYTVTAFYKLDGNTASYRFRLLFNGAVGTWSQPIFPLPSGHVIDTAKIPGGLDFRQYTKGRIFDSSPGDNYEASAFIYTTTSVLAQYASTVTHTGTAPSTPSAITNTAPFSWASGDALYFEINDIPLVGFPSSTIITPDAQGWFVSGEITGANPSIGTAAVTSPTEITNGSLTLTPSTNSAAVGIACATGTTSVVGSYTCGVNESFGFITNVPRSGVYEVCFGYTVSGATGNTVTFQISKTPANSSTPDLNGEQRTSFYNSSTTVAIGSTHRNCSNFSLSSGSNTFRLSFEQDAATNAPAIIADGNASLGQRNFSFSMRPVNSQQQAILANSVSTGRTNGDKIGSARLDCDSASTIKSNPQSMVSTISNISSGTCSLVLATGYFSGAPICTVSWDGSGGSSSDFYSVCSSATACDVGGGGAVTTAQINMTCIGPR